MKDKLCLILDVIFLAENVRRVWLPLQTRIPPAPIGSFGQIELTFMSLKVAILWVHCRVKLMIFRTSRKTFRCHWLVFHLLSTLQLRLNFVSLLRLSRFCKFVDGQVYQSHPAEDENGEPREFFLRQLPACSLFLLSPSCIHIHCCGKVKLWSAAIWKSSVWHSAYDDMQTISPWKNWSRKLVFASDVLMAFCGCERSEYVCKWLALELDVSYVFQPRVTSGGMPWSRFNFVKEIVILKKIDARRGRPKQVTLLFTQPGNLEVCLV